HRLTTQARALAARERSFCSVLMRAMSRRTSRMREGFSIWFVAAWKRRLNCSRFSWARRSTSWSSVSFRRSSILTILRILKQRFAKAGDHLGLDRQLLRGALERGPGERPRNAVQREQDAAGLHPRHPIFGRALARAHADLGGLGGNGHVREDADPQAPLTLDVAGDRAAGRLDLARGDPLRLQGLEAEGAEIERGAALGVAVDAALVRLAELCAFRLKHFLLSRQGVSGDRPGPAGRRRSAPPSSADPGRVDHGRESRP